MKILISIFVAALFFICTASADRIRGAYVGCITKDALDEFVGAAVNKDNRQMNALLGTKCFPIEGREFSVVKRGFVKSQIRVYVGSDSVLLWVPSEAAR